MTVKNVIAVMVYSDRMKNTLKMVQEQLFGSLIFINGFPEYYNLDKRSHIGLLIIESGKFPILPDSDQIHFFNVGAPRLILQRVNQNLFSLPISRHYHLGREDQINSEKLVELINNSFQQIFYEHGSDGGDEDQFVTKSPRMLKILQDARVAAQSDSNIFLFGENGTGKNLLARLIHGWSRRRENNFVKIFCETDDPELLKVDLFGSGKNISGKYSGKVRLASGGTLFLGRVNKLSSQLQFCLLKVIETSEVFYKNMAAKVNLRIISTADPQITSAMESGQFSRDLFNKLNVVNFHLPPLRERKEDLPLLITHFTPIFNKKYGKKVAVPRKNVLSKTLNHFWPGNVRELENFVERLVIRCESNIITAAQVENELKTLKQYGYAVAESKTLVSRMEEVEKQIIRHSLEGNNFKILEVARLLNISRQSLYRKMKKYGIRVSSIKKMNH